MHMVRFRQRDRRRAWRRCEGEAGLDERVSASREEACVFGVIDGTLRAAHRRRAGVVARGTA